MMYNSSTMTDSQLTPEQLAAQQIEETAKSVATAQMEKMKEELASNILGKEKVAPPKDWGEVARKEDIEKAISTAEEKAYARLQRERKAEEEKQAAAVQMSYQQQMAESQKELEHFSAEWKGFVDDGILPDIGEETKIRIAAKAPLTEEDRKDPGLVAFNETFASYVNKLKRGEPTSSYKTLREYSNKKSAGMSAPVFGGRPAVSQSSGHSYDEVHEIAEHMRRRR